MRRKETEMDDKLDKLEDRANQLGDWLAVNAPTIGDEQKHLDEGSVERKYWHYGYRVALLDAIKLLRVRH